FGIWGPPAVGRLRVFGGCRTSPASSGDMRLWRQASRPRSVARPRARARWCELDFRFLRSTVAGGLWPPTRKRVLQGLSTRAILHGKCFCQRLLQSQSRGGTHLQIRSEDSSGSLASALCSRENVATSRIASNGAIPSAPS